MRRTIVLLATMALTLLLASGVAWAVNKIGTDGSDTLRGTNGADNLIGRGGNDTLFALAGNDNLLGGAGKDEVCRRRRTQPQRGQQEPTGRSRQRYSFRWQRLRQRVG